MTRNLSLAVFRVRMVTLLIAAVVGRVSSWCSTTSAVADGDDGVSVIVVAVSGVAAAGQYCRPYTGGCPSQATTYTPSGMP